MFVEQSFVHAPHSRERLKTTREMLMSVLTYHQDMPAFMDFLIRLGLQEYPQDFDFSGFRQQTTLSDFDRGLRIPEVGRSGRGYQLCYSLKAVEQSKSQAEWPWSIRQTAIHHSFDVHHGRANWIVIKGDQLMKNRIRLAIKDTDLTGASDLHCIDRAFVLRELAVVHQLSPGEISGNDPTHRNIDGRGISKSSVRCDVETRHTVPLFQATNESVYAEATKNANESESME